MSSKRSRHELMLQSRSQDFEAVDRRQEKVAGEHLEPVLEPLLAWLQRLRTTLDHSMRQAINATTRHSESVHGTIDLHEYPKGFCGHIRDAIFKAMINAVAAGEEGVAQQGLRAFMAQGGICKPIFGIDVTGPYFQNAIQLGPYYLDVANDTVDIRKPQILFERMTKSRFENIQGLDRYFQVLKLYLRQTIFPSSFFPWLSTVSPAFTINASGYLELHALPMGLAASILLSDLQVTQQFLANSHSYTNTTLPVPYRELLSANRAAFTDDPLLAVTDPSSSRDHSAFQHLRTLARKSSDKYLFYFQHYQAVLKAHQKIHDLKLRVDAEHLMVLKEKGLVPDNKQS